MSTNSNTILSGIVKQVISGDTIVIRDEPKDRSPNMKTVVLMSISAPKLGKKRKDSEEKDEPYAWEAREFLRKKLVGQDVFFMSKPFPNAQGSSDRVLGKVFFPTKDDDITEDLVASGLVRVKKEKASKQGEESEQKTLIELEERAKAESKGIWNDDKEKHIRPVTYPNDYKKLVIDFNKQPVSAIIESVRNGPHMMMLDVILLPSFYSIPFAISGIKFGQDSDNYREEAKFFIECRLLQQDDVQVVIEKAMTNYVAGSVVHPKGNIAEALLKEGFLSCDDRTIASVIGGPVTLRAAEKFARDKRLRCWKNEEIDTPKVPKNEFHGIVTEISSGDAIFVKVPNTEKPKKVFLSNIRPPREPIRNDINEDGPKFKQRVQRPTIFDVPWLFEAREFLRKKLIGKKVTVTVDYTLLAKKSDDDEARMLPEKLCCTVMVGSTNIAEALVANGLATVVRHRERTDRSAHYDALCAAETKAMDDEKGLHSKGNPPKRRVNDLSGNKAAGLFPILQKADQITAIVEYVISGSRMRLYIPKDSLLITFFLSGIFSPRPSQRSSNVNPKGFVGEKCGDEALEFTRQKIFQREVEIHIESCDKRGCMLGSLTSNNINLALSLVEEGLAEVCSSCSERTLIQAEKVAKENKKGIWQYREENVNSSMEDETTDRKEDYKEVVVTSISPELHIFVHYLEDKKALQELETSLRQHLIENPPALHSKENPPKKGNCVAKYWEDNQWYRGKVEKCQGGKAIVYFVDYGNKEEVAFEDVAQISETYASPKQFAREFALACLAMPPEHYREDVRMELVQELPNRKLRMNIEYHDTHKTPYVTLVDAESNEDVNKACIAKSQFYVDHRRERRLRPLIKEYSEAEAKAKSERRLIWEYGDAREDDAKEFGLGK